MIQTILKSRCKEHSGYLDAFVGDCPLAEFYTNTNTNTKIPTLLKSGLLMGHSVL